MKPYKKVTKKNSEQYFKDFLAKKEPSLKWLKDFVDEKGGDSSKLDFSPVSLIHLWKTVSPYIKKLKPCPNYEEYLDELPLWFFLHYDSLCGERTGGYDLISLKIMEALVYYYAEVFIRNNNYHWEIWKVSKPLTDYNYLPVLMDDKREWLYPTNKIKVFAVRVWTKDSKLSKTNLYDNYKHFTSKNKS